MVEKKKKWVKHERPAKAETAKHEKSKKLALHKEIRHKLYGKE